MRRRSLALAATAIGAVALAMVTVVATRRTAAPHAPAAPEPAAAPSAGEPVRPTPLPERSAANPSPATSGPAANARPPSPGHFGPGAAAGAVHTTGGPAIPPGARERLLARIGDPELAEARAAHNAAEALAAYDRYLATHPTGASREQAMVGRASSLEALGDRTQAAAAWRAVLEKYPASLHAPQARRRMMALER